MNTTTSLKRALVAILLVASVPLLDAAPALANDGLAVGDEAMAVLQEGMSAQAATSFSDVTDQTAHADDIYWLARTEISAGWPNADGTASFRPYANVARADMAAFIYRLAKWWNLVGEGWQPKDVAVFSDVTSSTPHANEIWWLAEKGISAGWDINGKKEFRPYASVARQDMAAFLFRLAKIAKAGGASDAWSASSYARTMFSDVDSNSTTNHHNEIWWLAQMRVSEGWQVGTKHEFRGLLPVARADMAAFLHRINGLRSDDTETPEIPL